MNEPERSWFAALVKDRTDSMTILDKPSMRNIWRSIEDKYTAKAHFVYELLQNADDAKAASARFILQPDSLVFIHDGKKAFTISDPASEETDSGTIRLGSINAITSVANSSKLGAEIGKFGVGFKAVFGYTQTPHIYNPSLFFRIDRKIIPAELTADFPGRQPHETLFVFPFDHPLKKPPQAHRDIAEKLRSLVAPLLFLPNLLKISYTIADGPGISGSYSKLIERTLEFGETTAAMVCLTKQTGEATTEDRLWLFSRKDEAGRAYCVGFFLEDGALSPRTYPAFCFFPTKKETGLNFIVHAPFLLNDSREGILAGVEHNELAIHRLAQLAADSLVYLRDIGLEQGARLIDDQIFSIVPADLAAFQVASAGEEVSFRPFYECMKEKFSREALLPTADDYAAKEDAYWADDRQIAETFSDAQLAALCGQPGAKWVFRSQGRSVMRQADAGRRMKLTVYIDSITRKWLDEADIIAGWPGDGGKNRVGGITAGFIEQQPLAWLHQFYQFVATSERRIELIRTRPVFLDRQGKAVPAYNSERKPVLFLPSEDDNGFPTLDPRLLENEATANLSKIS